MKFPATPTNHFKSLLLDALLERLGTFFKAQDLKLEQNAGLIAQAITESGGDLTGLTVTNHGHGKFEVSIDAETKYRNILEIEVVTKYDNSIANEGRPIFDYWRVRFPNGLITSQEEESVESLYRIGFLLGIHCSLPDSTIEEVLVADFDYREAQAIESKPLNEAIIAERKRLAIIEADRVAALEADFISSFNSNYGDPLEVGSTWTFRESNDVDSRRRGLSVKVNKVTLNRVYLSDLQTWGDHAFGATYYAPKETWISHIHAGEAFLTTCLVDRPNP